MCKIKPHNHQSERWDSALKKSALLGSKMYLEVTPAMQPVFHRPCSSGGMGRAGGRQAGEEGCHRLHALLHLVLKPRGGQQVLP